MHPPKRTSCAWAPPRARRSTRPEGPRRRQRAGSSASAEVHPPGREAPAPTTRLLRARGGALSATRRTSATTGGPPRSRRSQRLAMVIGVVVGWTSALAEEPTPSGRTRPPSRVDLRARGGAMTPPSSGLIQRGGPPRSRRRLPRRAGRAAAYGWTSALAEEPASSAPGRRRRWVDLRARGGATVRRARGQLPMGGPPRSRRSLRVYLETAILLGWTSALAEEPPHLRTVRPRAAVDLRARGGADADMTIEGLRSGGPPRSRRSLPVERDVGRVGGWTSALAEEPRSDGGLVLAHRVDLRARGGADDVRGVHEDLWGGPPRSRRSHPPRDWLSGLDRWTSALAEEPML